MITHHTTLAAAVQFVATHPTTSRYAELPADGTFYNPQYVHHISDERFVDGELVNLGCPLHGVKGEPETTLYPECEAYGCYRGETQVKLSSYIGATLTDREENWHDDSDFYAIVWDEAEQTTRRVEWGTTRFAMTGCSCRCDATPEVQALAQQATADKLFGLIKQGQERKARRVEKGRYVVTKGAKRRAKNIIPNGVRGDVVKVDTFKTGYSEWTRQTRALVWVDEGVQFWIDVDRLEVVEPLWYMHDDTEIRRQAVQSSTQYHYPFASSAVSAIIN